MAYVDSEYYFNTYKGTTLSTENVDKYLKIASRQVDNLTFNRINLDKITPFQNTIIKETTCELAEFYFDNKDQINSCLSSYSINGVSMNFGSTEGVRYIDGIFIPSNLYEYLSQTGLCVRLL